MIILYHLDLRQIGFLSLQVLMDAFLLCKFERRDLFVYDSRYCLYFWTQRIYLMGPCCVMMQRWFLLLIYQFIKERLWEGVIFLMSYRINWTCRNDEARIPF